MLFHLDFRVEYGATWNQKDLFAIWAREAVSALGAKDAGVIVDLWKVAGERRVIAIVDLPDHDAVDEALFTLPIMVEMGQFVDIKVSPLRRYEDFAATVNKLLES
jgi:muconolactone delta-isomerase